MRAYFVQCVEVLVRTIASEAAASSWGGGRCWWKRNNSEGATSTITRAFRCRTNCSNSVFWYCSCATSVSSMAFLAWLRWNRICGRSDDWMVAAADECVTRGPRAIPFVMRFRRAQGDWKACFVSVGGRDQYGQRFDRLHREYRDCEKFRSVRSDLGIERPAGCILLTPYCTWQFRSLNPDVGKSDDFPFRSTLDTCPH